MENPWLTVLDFTNHLRKRLDHMGEPNSKLITSDEVHTGRQEFISLTNLSVDMQLGQRD